METPNRVLCNGKLSHGGVYKENKQDPKLNIFLDTSVFFFPGSEIKGVLIWDNHKEHEIEKVKLKFVAFEHVQWSERHGNTTVTYIGHSNIMKTKSYLMGDTKSKIKVTPQIYQLPFTLVLPMDYCPQTVNYSPIANIQYKISAQIKYTGIKINKSTKGHVVVFKPIPQAINDKETYEHKHNEMKNVSHSVWVEGKTFYQGDVVSLKLYVDNLSTHKINSIYAKIKQINEYCARSKTKRIVLAVAQYKVNKDNIPNVPHSDWHCPEVITLAIPPDCHVSILPAEAKIIHIYHFLSVTIKYDFMKGRAKVKFPIEVIKKIA